MTKAFKSPVNIPTGSIGGLTISSSGLYNQGSASSYAGFQSASNASYSFFAGAQSSLGSNALFSVTPQGTLTSNSASISGSISFYVGTLGNWTISSSGIYGGNITSGSANFTTASISGSVIATQLWVQSQGYGSGSGTAITTSSTSFTSSSIVSSSVLSTTIPIGKTFILSRLTTNIPARIRLYADTATRDADVGRAVGTTPTGNHGLIFEIVTSSILDYYISPAVTAYVSSSNVPVNITNLSASSASVIINLTTTILER